MSEQFQWTVDLMSEFILNIKNGQYKNYNAEYAVQVFKESKQPKPEWEIMKIRGLLSPELIWDFNNKFPPDFDKWEIYSVKRVSDSEIFTIGDKFTANAGCDLTIKSFEIDGCDLKVWSVEYGHWLLKDIKKHVSLFKTEDGTSIYEGMEYWYVSSWTIFSKKAVQGSGTHGFKYFSTKEKAEEWMFEHKPILSFNEIKWAIDKSDWSTIKEQMIRKTKQVDSQQS